MMNIKEQVTNWLNEAMAESTFFLLEVRFNEKKLQFSVLIDGDHGVPIGQCVEMSRLLNVKLEESYGEEHPYSFDVSSPGADSPLKLARQYRQHVGRDLQVTLTDGTVIAGKLKAFEDNKLTLVQNQKGAGNKNLGKEKVISFPDIKEATVILKFK
jgi:ribosome maturation factor RimP